MALPSSGSLSIKGAAGSGRSISMEVDGNETGNKSLSTLSASASKSAPHSMLEFLGYAHEVIPGAPTSITATYDSTFDRVQVSWTPPVDGDTTPDNYRLERSTDGSTWSFLADKGTSLTHNDTSVPAPQYYYRVRAENSVGVSGWRVSSVVNTI